MRTLPISAPEPKRSTKTPALRADASVRDSVRVLTEIVTQLSERIEVLEARDLLNRAR